MLNGFPIKNSMLKVVRAQQSTDVPGAEPSAPTGGSLLHTAAAPAAAAAAAHTTKWGTSWTASYFKGKAACSYQMAGVIMIITAPLTGMFYVCIQKWKLLFSILILDVLIIIVIGLLQHSRMMEQGEPSKGGSVICCYEDWGGHIQYLWCLGSLNHTTCIFQYMDIIHN